MDMENLVGKEIETERQKQFEQIQLKKRKKLRAKKLLVYLRKNGGTSATRGLMEELKVVSGTQVLSIDKKIQEQAKSEGISIEQNQEQKEFKNPLQVIVVEVMGVRFPNSM